MLHFLGLGASFIQRFSMSPTFFLAFSVLDAPSAVGSPVDDAGVAVSIRGANSSTLVIREIAPVIQQSIKHEIAPVIRPLIQHAIPRDRSIKLSVDLSIDLSIYKWKG